MTLAQFIADLARRKALAEALRRSPDYLWQIAKAWRGRRASPELAIAIERESALIGPESVPKESLRPDIWGEPADAERAA